MKRNTFGGGRAATDKEKPPTSPARTYINLADIYGTRRPPPMPKVVKVDHRTPGDWADYLENLSEGSRREPHG